MKKKLLLMLSAVAVSAGVIVTTSAEETNEISLVVNGETIECDQAPVIVDSRTLVPLRAAAEAVGADVAWNAETKTASIDSEAVGIEVTVGSADMAVTAKAADVETTVTLDVAAQIISDRTMVPVRAIAEGFGCEVNWDGETRTVYIVSEDAEETTVVESTEATTEEGTFEDTTAEDTTAEETTVEETTEVTTVEEASEETTEAEEDVETTTEADVETTTEA